MNDNLKIYNQVRQVPQEAQKSIGGGRLRNMTDINPMWRIKTLTEQFGQVGIGWYTEMLEQRLEIGADSEVAAFCNINLYVKVDGEWSKPIFGTGGSSFIAKEKTGLYTNDECYKMAYTDALSVSCKALGVGADIYWDKDKTKYSINEEEKTTNTKPKTINLTEAKELEEKLLSKGQKVESILEWAKISKLSDLPQAKYYALIKKL